MEANASLHSSRTMQVASRYLNSFLSAAFQTRCLPNLSPSSASSCHPPLSQIQELQGAAGCHDAKMPPFITTPHRGAFPLHADLTATPHSAGMLHSSTFVFPERIGGLFKLTFCCLRVPTGTAGNIRNERTRQRSQTAHAKVKLAALLKLKAGNRRRDSSLCFQK